LCTLLEIAPQSSHSEVHLEQILRLGADLLEQDEGFTCQLAGEQLLISQLMRQVLSNLLSNAIKYAPADTTITIERTHGENQFILSDIDQLIFDPFHRAHDAREYAGTGLGLAIPLLSEPSAGTKATIPL
jgi:signal transduction histidine kinase